MEGEVERVTRDEDSLDKALKQLHQEFEPGTEWEVYREKQVGLTIYPSESFTNPEEEVPNRGTDVFMMRDDEGNVIGVSQVRYYDFDVLGPQLYFVPERGEGGDIQSIRLQPMKDAVRERLKTDEDPDAAAELAYYWVREDLRREGLGAQLFSEPMEGFTEAYEEESGERPFSFVIAMGNASGSGRGQELLMYLLDKEREQNGELEDGRVKITGIDVPWQDIQQELDLTERDFKVREESKATEITGKRLGMKFIGYSRNLSPTYGKVD